ncbi:MAG TPA: sigma-54 dependent transcriptional regulator [Xanthomonadaceae bacterium]|nr:sigma-54 dependent transcriptional regulator [Xanthomonadaceae bacterium]
MTSAHILVVDDEPDIRELVREILADEGYSVETAANAEAARASRRRQRPDLVLLDIWMPDTDGISLLREWSAQGGLPCPVIMMSGHGTIETAVEATRLGAWDFVEKPIALAKLLLTIERALEANRLRLENEGLRRKLPPVEPIGGGRALESLRTQIGKLAAHDTPVLLRGEAGTGKETLARWLHDRSPRRGGPFVVLAPGSVGRDAALALLGAEDGGQVHYGLLEQANGGTLFLDEVADLDADLQHRLASALERRSLLRVNGAAHVTLDARVVAASSRDLEALVREGRFREELYYQLNVVPVNVPSLRDRSDDVPELLEHFARFFAERDSLPTRRFAAAAQDRLRRHTWPGNLRELRNLVQRLLVMGQGEIGVDEVEQALGRAPSSRADVAEDTVDLPLREAREQFERAYLSRQLAAAGGSVGKLAKMAGMERTHLYRKLRDLGIDLKSAKDD